MSDKLNTILFAKNKDEAIRYAEISEYKANATSKEFNYKPWYLELTNDKQTIDQSWFPQQDYNKVSGDFFTVYPSMPLYPPKGLKFNGTTVKAEKFNIAALCLGTTGGGLLVLNKK